MRFLRLFIIVGILVAGCGAKKNTEGDPIFRIETGLLPNIQLKDIPVDIPARMDLNNWPHGGFYTELGPFNLSYGGTFSLLKPIISLKNHHFQDREIGTPIIIDGIIYAVNGNGVVVAKRLSDKKLLWRTNIKRKIHKDGQSFRQGFISYGDDTIFVTLQNGSLFALSRHNGSIIWNKDLKLLCRAPFKYSDGYLYGITSTNATISINAKNGNLVWRYESVNEKHITIHNASATIMKDVIISCDSHGQVTCIDKKNGQALWNHNLAYGSDFISIFDPHDIDSAPAIINDDFIIVGAIIGQMALINVRTGEIIWQKQYGSTGQIMPTNNFIFFIDNHARLVCTHIQSAEIKWFVQLDKIIELPAPKYITDGAGRFLFKLQYIGPMIIQDLLFIMSQFGQIYIFNPQNGELIDESRFKFMSRRPPLISDNKMYIVNNDADNLVMIR